MVNSYNFVSTYADFANHIFKKIDTQLENIFIQKKKISKLLCQAQCKGYSSEENIEKSCLTLRNWDLVDMKKQIIKRGRKVTNTLQKHVYPPYLSKKLKIFK